MALKMTQQRQLNKYGVEALDYIHASKLLSKYISRKATRSAGTGANYKAKLTEFGYFIYSKVNSRESLDTTIAKIAKGEIDALDLLADYTAYLTAHKAKANTLRAKVKLARRFLKFNGANIDLENFHEQVALPQRERPEFKAVDKSEIVELLSACKSQRLKSVIMFVAVTGARITEACSVRLSDIDLKNHTVTFRAENTKTRTERTRYITNELAKQIELWLKTKYAPHRVYHSGEGSRVTPEQHGDDLVFAYWNKKGNPTAQGLSEAVRQEFDALTNLLNVKMHNGRREITFHRFRAFAKSAISDLGYSDFSEWHIGHSASTYYRKPEAERFALFKKLELYLTFLDVTAMDATQRDLQSQVEQLQNQLKDKTMRDAELQEAHASAAHAEYKNRLLREFLIEIAKKTKTQVPPELLKDDGKYEV